ncbi:MAG: pyridoxamine 5'-phosphate oxidase [Cellvibrionaceae bacterium]|nr:pyridoxamine 5'-phosphate oxidase [Cellvibrionaceae bacterium]
MALEIDQLRREYLRGGLQREDLAACPIEQFQHWLDQAVKAELKDPTAMTLATVSSEGQPSQRIVLLKGLDQRGFVFYTNYGSRKASEISTNNKVSIHFPWHELERQVKICGEVEKLPSAESLKYFLSRPKESQLAAWASAQSRPISSRQLLMQQFNSMKEKFAKGEVPLPDFWGGYRVRPSQIEFWQGGANRLHDRFEYYRDGDNWGIQRLAP